MQITRAEPLRYDSFEAELAGVAEYNVAGLVDMVIKMQRRPRFAEQLGESALALLGRFPAQVFAAQDDMHLDPASNEPARRIGENPPYGMIGRVEETTASFEARVRASTLPDCGGRAMKRTSLPLRAPGKAGVIQPVEVRPK